MLTPVNGFCGKQGLYVTLAHLEEGWLVAGVLANGIYNVDQRVYNLRMLLRNNLYRHVNSSTEK